MSRWSDIPVPTERLKWVEVLGVPLHCWCKAFFLRVGSYMGETIWVDEETENRGRFDVGQILVLGSHESQATRMVQIKVGGKSFLISLMESPEPVSFLWIVQHLGLKPEFKNSNSQRDRFAKYSGTRGMTDSDKVCHSGRLLQRDNKEPREDMLDRSPELLGRDNGSATYCSGKVEIRGDKVSGKRNELDKGKSSWVYKSKPHPRWNPLPNTSVKIGKVRSVRSDFQTSSSNSSTSESDSDRGEMAKLCVARGECSFRRQISNQSGARHVGTSHRPSIMGLYHIEPNTYSKFQLVKAHSGAKKDQWAVGTGSSEGTHVSPTNDRDCPGYVSMESKSDQDQVEKETGRKNELNPVRPGLNLCVDLCVQE
ncbi:hypothetical protein LWI29_000968 [Acer saccharum]|uniref:DUF4283 domain-containing protein n=1 Tax=Acer saccharum TaxID=4024 RepID=A0AA39V646_ACESA|nr:hypothetical protein LWI29_000968 [Acer saccharum]